MKSPFNCAQVTCLAVGFFVRTIYAQTPAVASDRLISAIAQHAETLQQRARLVVSDETLVQRTYKLRPHSHVSVGGAGEQSAAFVVTEVVSQYSIGSLRGDRSGSLLEFREILEQDGRRIQTPEAARKALEQDVSSGETAIRKKILREFTDLGLVDVATDYGLILLAFTTSGLKGMELKPAGSSSWIGTEQAIAFDWRQTTGGALEFRGRTVNRRAMRGRIWVRERDGLPLRISARIEHDEPQHTLRDDAVIDYVLSSFGGVTPASVVHRHFVDGGLLTENLYTYTPFRVFTAETSIQYGDPAEPKK